MPLIWSLLGFVIMSNALQIAVVGSGIGAEHIKGYQELPELFEVKVLCDVDVERAAPVAEKYGIPKVTGSFDEVCRRPDIDVIDVCTPPGFHLDQIQLALKAGKHVICEKPLVGSLAAVDLVSRRSALEHAIAEHRASGGRVVVASHTPIDIGAATAITLDAFAPLSDHAAAD